MTSRPRPTGFTLVELLVTIAVLTLLIGILLPSLSRANKQAKGVLCKTRLASLGHGIAMYTDDNKGALMPGRLPKIDTTRWAVEIAGGLKYRPTFLAIMGKYVGVPAFDSPAPTKATHNGERGDRQNYTNDTYLCPAVSDWADERNGAFGYNYQFLGNSRLLDEGDMFSFKNWPVKISLVKSPGECVAVGDAMGTAAAQARRDRAEYKDDTAPDEGRDPTAFGNEGFNLDPPWVATGEHGEMADKETQVRSAVHDRHLGLANILWLDGHGSSETFATLGYEVEDSTGIVQMTGKNLKWHPRRQDVPWTEPGTSP
ncbi:MAG TPA: prepilin-type N-terminal cleavage/methylation domain-containing protein [Phycisphaerae bacterium]|nr:prepilin-type N-terminal cleavage/methylation domain-containing protein [Phycisphaerae bacterium]HNU47124.1 prepilin-type N-terminal cleavage/methylation domain-containing protein [Phycisphaerae bacterium]